MLRIGIDTAYDELDGTKYRNEPQRIYDLLTRYSKSKTDPELAFFAKGILQALAAADKYNKAMRKGDEIGAIDHKIDYADARAEFHRKADRMNRKLRNRLFDKLPKEVSRF